MWKARGARLSPEVAPFMAMAVASRGCLRGSVWFEFALVLVMLSNLDVKFEEISIVRGEEIGA